MDLLGSSFSGDGAAAIQQLPVRPDLELGCAVGADLVVQTDPRAEGGVFPVQREHELGIARHTQTLAVTSPVDRELAAVAVIGFAVAHVALNGAVAVGALAPVEVADEDLVAKRREVSGRASASAATQVHRLPISRQRPLRR